MTKSALAELDEAVDRAVAECQELDYNPMRFRVMRAQYGAVETMRKLIARRDVSDGFITLLERARLDLTIEAIALRFPYFFSEAELDICRERLKVNAPA